MFYHIALSYITLYSVCHIILCCIVLYCSILYTIHVCNIALYYVGVYHVRFPIVLPAPGLALKADVPSPEAKSDKLRCLVVVRSLSRNLSLLEFSEDPGSGIQSTVAAAEMGFWVKP